MLLLFFQPICQVFFGEISLGRQQIGSSIRSLSHFYLLFLSNSILHDNDSYVTLPWSLTRFFLPPIYASPNQVPLNLGSINCSLLSISWAHFLGLIAVVIICPKNTCFVLLGADALPWGADLASDPLHQRPWFICSPWSNTEWRGHLLLAVKSLRVIVFRVSSSLIR